MQLTTLNNQNIAVFVQNDNARHEQLVCIHFNFKLLCWIWQIQNSAHTHQRYCWSAYHHTLAFQCNSVISTQVRRFLVSAINVQTQNAMAQLNKHKRFQRSFELSKGDIRLPKLFRQKVAKRWPSSDKTVVIELVAWSLDQACRMSANRRWRQLAAVASVRSSARYTGAVPANKQ